MTHYVNRPSNPEVKRRSRHRRFFRLMFRLLNSTKCLQKSLVVSHKNKWRMSTGANKDLNNSENRSIHSDNIEEVHNVPMDVITRPIPSVLDELKVQSLMKTIKVICVLYIYISIQPCVIWLLSALLNFNIPQQSLQVYLKENRSTGVSNYRTFVASILSISS